MSITVGSGGGILFFNLVNKSTLSIVLWAPHRLLIIHCWCMENMNHCHYCCFNQPLQSRPVLDSSCCFVMFLIRMLPPALLHKISVSLKFKTVVCHHNQPQYCIITICDVLFGFSLTLKDKSADCVFESLHLQAGEEVAPVARVYERALPPGHLAAVCWAGCQLPWSQ